MLKPAVTLDAYMSAAAVLQRLALRGFWLDPNHAAASARIATFATRLNQSFEVTAKAMSRDVRSYGAAIRLQSGTRVLWFVMELRRVLEACAMTSAETRLQDALALSEKDADPILRLSREADTVLSRGVVMDNDTPVAVCLVPAVPAPVSVQPPPSAARARSAMRGPLASVEDSTASDTNMWPRMVAPPFVRAGERFKLFVGLGGDRQSGVVGGPVTLVPESGHDAIDVTVQLIAGPELSAPEGWTRSMRVPVNEMCSPQVCFELIGAEPADPNVPHLTMLEVRYIHAGAVWGTAAKPLVILHSRAEALASEQTEERSQPAPLPFVIATDPAAPDLTIEITKSDRSSTSGQYVYQCYSPHRLDTPGGPFPMDLGQDASTFARAIVDEVALFARSPLIETTLEGIGKLIAQRIPAGVFDALREVAGKTAPRAPAVMIVSAEPYVPWEMAWIEPALDEQRPNFLGAQVILGRWLRDYSQRASSASLSPTHPAAHPRVSLGIRNVALVAAWYKASSGLRKLLKAEEEIAALATDLEGITLQARAQVMKDLLQGVDLRRGAEVAGPMHALHFSGHGDFDPTKPDAAALFLEDGVPMRSTLFRATRFASDQQPLMFLNACMLGIGGELLGDMAGFPGNSLRGGFGGVIGALWEIDDSLARDFALEFWRRALPPPHAEGEPIGAILRDLRAKWRGAADGVPPATYLAYVYYGHPNLRLQRVQRSTSATFEGARP